MKYSLFLLGIIIGCPNCSKAQDDMIKNDVSITCPDILFGLLPIVPDVALNRIISFATTQCFSLFVLEQKFSRASDKEKQKLTDEIQIVKDFAFIALTALKAGYFEFSKMKLRETISNDS